MWIDWIDTSNWYQDHVLSTLKFSAFIMPQDDPKEDVIRPNILAGDLPTLFKKQQSVNH